METVNEFINACIYNKIYEVNRLIEEDKNIVNLKETIGGTTGLMWAASNNHIEVVRRILSNPDVDISVSNDDGYTVLHECCINNSIDSLNLILQHPHCDPEFLRKKNLAGDTAEMLAKNEGFKECVRLINKRCLGQVQATRIFHSTGSISDHPSFCKRSD